jgi:hypothetical protein
MAKASSKGLIMLRDLIKQMVNQSPETEIAMLSSILHARRRDEGAIEMQR